MKVLIADDNPEYGSTMADIVNSFGHYTELFNTPGDTIDYLDKNHRDISVAFLDIEFGSNLIKFKKYIVKFVDYIM